MKFFVFLSSLLLLLVQTACQPSVQHELSQFSGQTMGTTYQVKIVDLPKQLSLSTLQSSIDKQLQHINALMSTYQDDSELSQINQNPSTDWLTVSSELFFVIQAAQQVSQLTQGAFDISVGPLVNLWGFGPAIRMGQLPTTSDIQAATARGGYTKVDLRDTPTALKKQQADIYLDLSAIAKGYAVDQIADDLQQQGIDNYLVDIGGELRVAGINAKGQPWQIAIEQPNVGQRAVQRVISLDNIGVATSGSYRNFFTIEDKTYSHTINPKTGWPVEHQTVSATVLHPRTMQADAWATAFMVLDIPTALALAEQQNLPIMLIEMTDTGGKEHYSSAFQAYLSSQ